jgi:uncharacterized heparinase superfamily protein
MFAAAGAALARQARREWLGSPPHRLMLKGVPSHGLAAEPRDLRPADPEIGAAVLAGEFTYAGQAMALGKHGHPWDQASPNRRFAVALHRFEWLPHLFTQGPAGAAEALRLVLEWRRLFGKWNDFSWGVEVMERRLFNLACAIGDLSRAAGPEEAERLRADLARQAQALAAQTETWREAERLATSALVYAALAGQPAEHKLQAALDRLAGALSAAVAADGGHASRSPEAAMELLLDLRVLDETLAQRGWPAPQGLLGAIDRLTGALRFFALADGRLPALQGGGDATPERVAAALAHARPAETRAAQRGGFERLESRRLQVVVDAAAAAAGPWSLTACAQPAALEILADGALLICGAGWSPDAMAPQAVRLAPAASTATLGEESCGEPLGGFAGRALGPRLAGAPAEVRSARQEADAAVWLELSHDGWAPAFGLRHERRLYLDLAADDLRGEDRFTPIDKPIGRYQPFAVRFHLDPSVTAEVGEERAVRLSRPGLPDWMLRSDAAEVLIEPAIRYQNAVAQRTTQVLLRSQVPPEDAARLRWRLEAG